MRTHGIGNFDLTYEDVTEGCEVLLKKLLGTGLGASAQHLSLGILILEELLSRTVLQMLKKLSRVWVSRQWGTPGSAVDSQNRRRRIATKGIKQCTKRSSFEILGLFLVK